MNSHDTDEPFDGPALVRIEWSLLRPSVVSRVDPRQRRYEQRHADVNRLRAARHGAASYPSASSTAWANSTRPTPRASATRRTVAHSGLVWPCSIFW